MRVKVTWRSEDGIKMEDVWLAEQDEPMIDIDGNLLPVSVDDIIDETGWVIFQNEFGMFGLVPECIISVEPIDRNIYNSYDENKSNRRNIMKRIKKFAKDNQTTLMVAGYGTMYLWLCYAAGKNFGRMIKIANALPDE